MEPILEQLAQWHETLLASVTTTNGYQQTLTASRSQEKFLDGDAIGDLDVLCALSGAEGAVEKMEATLDPINGFTTWRQRFDAFVHVLGRGATEFEEDQRIARIIADVHKAVGHHLATQRDQAGRVCGGLADWVFTLPWEIGISPAKVCTVVNIPLMIEYTVLNHDPYSQS